MEWLIIILGIIGIVVVLGLGRAVFKGYPMSFRDFIITMFFVDIISEEWNGSDPGMGEDASSGDGDADF